MSDTGPDIGASEVDRADDASIQAATHAAGGADSLAQLIADAKTFLPANEIADYNRWLGDPRTREATIKLLRDQRAEHARTSANADPSTSLSAYLKLERRAMSGDPAARAEILALTPKF